MEVELTMHESTTLWSDVPSEQPFLKESSFWVFNKSNAAQVDQTDWGGCVWAALVHLPKSMYYFYERP